MLVIGYAWLNNAGDLEREFLLSNPKNPLT